MTRAIDLPSAESEDRILRADSLQAGFALLLVLTIGQRLLGFLRQVLICRYMDPIEVGRWNLTSSMIILAAPLLVLGIPGTFGRYTEYYRQRGQLHGFLRRTLRVTAYLTLAGIALLVLLAQPVAWLLFRDLGQYATVRLIGFALLTIVAFNVALELLVSLRQVKSVSWFRFGFSGLFFLFSGLIFAVNETVNGIVISYAAASLVIAVWAGWVLYRTLGRLEPDGRPLSQQSVWMKLLPFAGWMWLADLLSNLFAASDRYMIVHFAPLDATAAAGVVGQYHSSRLIPEQIYGLAVLFCGILLPYLSYDWERGERQAIFAKLNLTFKWFSLSMTTGGALFLWIAPWLFHTVLDGKYADGLMVTPLTLLSFIWFGMYVFAQTYLLCCEKGRACSLALLLGLVANVGLNYWLLPQYGLLGAVVATSLANGLTLLLAAFLCQRHGMQWHAGIWTAAILPATLPFGPAVSLVTVLMVVVGNFLRPILFSPVEVSQLQSSLPLAVSRWSSYQQWLISWGRKKYHASAPHR